jgi:hypothetical protein
MMFMRVRSIYVLMLHEILSDRKLHPMPTDLQQIPLETLMKAQRKLNKQARLSNSKADTPQLEESAEEGAGNGRRGRTEARRGVVADKAVPRKAKESAKPKARDNKHASVPVRFQ